MGRLFCSGAVNPNDHFIFTDAWHPGIINLKYMSELLNIPVTTHGLWHAGSYDPQDFLGRLVGDKPWVRHAEKSFFECFDHNYFATYFHVKMFTSNLLDLHPMNAAIHGFFNTKKIVRTGWPMEYMDELLVGGDNVKDNLIVFPHRIAPEKQVEIFRDLATQLPEYEFVVCQDQQLTKHQYHNLLKRAKIVFSANLQETLGISMYEGALVDATPMVPDRLSYTEMYDDWFKYPSEWTESWDQYITNRDLLVAAIRVEMDQYHDLQRDRIRQQAKHLTENFFSATALLKHVV